MGRVRRAETEAQRLKRQRAPKRVKGNTLVTATKETEKLLKMFPEDMREKVLKQAVRAAGGAVRNKARANIAGHRSEKTGTADKQSKEVRERRAGRPMGLWKSITVVVKTYKNAVVAFVGPRRPWGNHGNLIEYGATVRLWGSDRTVYLPPRPFMRDAADTTKAEQKRRALQKLKREWLKI